MQRFIACLVITSVCLLVDSCQPSFHGVDSFPPCNTSAPPRESPKGVVGLNFTRDGRVLASANADFTIKFWDMQSGQVSRIFRGHTNVVYKAIFSPDEKLLASCSRDFTARIWDAATGKELHVLKGHKCAVKSVAFSPDGKTLASVSNDGRVKLWDVQTGAEVQSLVHLQKSNSVAPVYSVVFTPDGRGVFAGNGDGTISRWDVATGREMNVWQAQDQDVNALALGHHKRLLASAGHNDFTTKLWDAGTGAEIRNLASTRTPGVSEQVVTIAFSPDDKLLASSELGFDSREGKYVFSRTRVWNVEKGIAVLTTGGHQFDIDAVDFTPDGRLLVTSGVEGLIKFWDVQTGKEVRTFTNQPDDDRR